MAKRTRAYCLEILEGRQLLSNTLQVPHHEVAIVATQKQKTISVVGVITGVYGLGPLRYPPIEHLSASGNLPNLGLVQMTATLVAKTKRGTITLATSEGTINFAASRKIVGSQAPLKLSVRHGTNAYAGWSGGGTDNAQWVTTLVGPLPPTGPPPVTILDSNMFNLKFKT